jgi:hypothetical protein
LIVFKFGVISDWLLFNQSQPNCQKVMQTTYDPLREKFFAFLTKKGLDPSKLDMNAKKYQKAMNEYTATLSFDEMEDLMCLTGITPLETDWVREVLAPPYPQMADMIELLYLSREPDYQNQLYDLGLSKRARELFDGTQVLKNRMYREVCLLILGQMAQFDKGRLVKDGLAVFASSLLNDQYDSVFQFYAIQILLGLLRSGNLSQTLIRVLFKRVIEMTEFKAVVVRNSQTFDEVSGNIVEVAINFLMQVAKYLDDNLEWKATLVEAGFLSRVTSFLDMYPKSMGDMWYGVCYAAIGILTDDRSLLQKLEQSMGPDLKIKLKTFCYFCGKMEIKDSPMKKCGQCRKATYCSQDCQARDWKVGHRGRCKKV